MPTLRQLEYLVTIADTLHFRRAAERSNTTQSTLSLQLKALEDRLGAELVARDKGQIRLTAVGADVVVIARRMLRDAQVIRDLARSRSSTLSGILRLGVPPSIGPSLLPRVVPWLSGSFPLLKLYVREDLAQYLMPSLCDGDHDLVIAALPLARDGITVRALMREPLYLTFASGHALAQLQTITVTDLRDVDILTLGPAHPLHHAVRPLCENAGARLRFDYEGTSLDMLREMAAMGLGATFLPGLYLRARGADSQDLVAREIAAQPLARTIAIAWRSAAPQAAAYARLADLIHAQLAADLPEFALRDHVSDHPCTP